MMTNRIAPNLMLTAVLASTPLTMAQDTGPEAPATPLPYSEVWEAWTPSWSSPDIKKAATALTGEWRTTNAVSELGGDADGSSAMMMCIHPAPVSGVADALYVEQYRADNPGKPFRQAVMQLYAYKDGLRLRTYELLRGDDGKGVLVGMGHITEAFPEISRDELIATLDLDLSMSGSGFKGKTPYPYPTGVGGAVEMTSEMAVMGNTMRTADRGWAADGTVAWGTDQDATYEWTRTEPWAKVSKLDGGLAIIDMNDSDGTAPEAGGRVFVHYTGWTADGNKFDSSIDKGQPWPLTWPVSEMRVIDGWKQGFEGVVEGTIRKLVIPASLAYGDRGVPRAGIGANATLYFNTEVMAVQEAPETETPETDPEAEADDGSDS